LPQWKNTADEPLEVSPMNSSNWGDALPIFFEESSTREHSSSWKKAHDAYRRKVAKLLPDDESSWPVEPAKSPTHEYSSSWKKAHDVYRRRVAKLLTPAASSLPTESAQSPDERQNHGATGAMDGLYDDHRVTSFMSGFQDEFVDTSNATREENREAPASFFPAVHTQISDDCQNPGPTCNLDCSMDSVMSFASSFATVSAQSPDRNQGASFAFDGLYDEHHQASPSVSELLEASMDSVAFDEPSISSREEEYESLSMPHRSDPFLQKQLDSPCLPPDCISWSEKPRRFPTESPPIFIPTRFYSTTGELYDDTVFSDATEALDAAVTTNQASMPTSASTSEHFYVQNNRSQERGECYVAEGYNNDNVLLNGEDFCNQREKAGACGDKAFL
jgi:hypothetical protein